MVGPARRVWAKNSGTRWWRGAKHNDRAGSTFAFEGTQVLDVDVQVQISSGIVAFNIVGLPDKAVAESRERVRTALQGMGLSFLAKRVTVNLAPADVLKEGSHFDLPIKLGLLTATGVLPTEDMQRYCEWRGRWLIWKILNCTSPTNCRSFELSPPIGSALKI
jgi:hypothetical protein